MADLPSFNIEDLSFLVCDNDVNMCSMVASMLRTLGVKSLRKTNDGEEALKKLSDSAPDIFICEWDVGEISGIEIANRIRLDENNPARMTSIIFLTAHTQVGQVTEARDAGITEYLAKPVSAETLYSRICSVIMNPRAFIIAETFVGPDRRRQHDPFKIGMSRRESDQITPEDLADGVVDDDEVSKMLGL
ncbi:response regulator [Magnetovibrio sp. PR-2]|uniref:response regulator n=1 Tax=Magnetovibrio sp. PR-2 TaxID=3120356 RepID=UPI002FCE2E18